MKTVKEAKEEDEEMGPSKLNPTLKIEIGKMSKEKQVDGIRVAAVLEDILEAVSEGWTELKRAETYADGHILNKAQKERLEWEKK